MEKKEDFVNSGGNEIRFQIQFCYKKDSLTRFFRLPGKKK